MRWYQSLYLQVMVFSIFLSLVVFITNEKPSYRQVAGSYVFASIAVANARKDNDD